MDRVCKVCGVEKPIEKFYCREGYRMHRCVACECNRMKAYYETHKVALAARKAQYRETHKVALAASSAKYRETHKEAITASAAQYRAANTVELRAKYAKYVASLPEPYIRALLKHGTSLTSKDIPQSLVEAKRLQMQILRMSKNEKC